MMTFSFLSVCLYLQNTRSLHTFWRAAASRHKSGWTTGRGLSEVLLFSKHLHGILSPPSLLFSGYRHLWSDDKAAEA